MVTRSTILSHFESADPILFPLFQSLPFDIIQALPPQKYFESLCRHVIGQQLSGRVADVIYERFESLFPKKIVSPQKVYEYSDEKFRSVGMSWSKARFLKALAESVVHKYIDLDSLKTLKDEEVISFLTQIKGIGPWTAEMFLMFTLGRVDVFSYGDLGLRRVMQKIYGFKNEPTKKQMENIVSKWIPYRTYGARILWTSLDNK